MKLETGHAKSGNLKWVYYIFTDPNFPNFRVEMLAYYDYEFVVNNSKVTSLEFHDELSRFLKELR